MRTNDHSVPTTPSVQVIERIFQLIDVLASREEAMSLKEISEKTGLHPSTTHRILNDLTVGRYVERPETGAAWLEGPKPAPSKRNVGDGFRGSRGRRSTREMVAKDDPLWRGRSSTGRKAVSPAGACFMRLIAPAVAAVLLAGAAGSAVAQSTPQSTSQAPLQTRSGLAMTPPSAPRHSRCKQRYRLIVSKI